MPQSVGAVAALLVVCVCMAAVVLIITGTSADGLFRVAAAATNST